MAELATIARPYAQALYGALKKQGAIASLDWLDVAAAVATSDEVLALAQHPKVSHDQVSQLLIELIGAKAPLNEVARHFVELMVKNKRLAAMSEVAHQVQQRYHADQGVSQAQVFSAFPLDDAALGDLAKALQKQWGRSLELSVHIDPELIGGVRVVVGDEVLDTSIKAQLEQMKGVLTA